MASSSEGKKVTGYRKKDVDKNLAEFVVVVKNLQKKDVVKVIFPGNRDETLRVFINDILVSDKLLPSSILPPPESKFKVNCGKRGEIKIKLRKAEPSDWVNRWSPSRDVVKPLAISGPSPHTSSSSTPSISVCDGSERSGLDQLESRMIIEDQSQQLCVAAAGESSGPIITLIDDTE